MGGAQPALAWLAATVRQQAVRKLTATLLTLTLVLLFGCDAPALELPRGIETHADGRLPIEDLYRSYTSLLDHGWQLDVILQSEPAGTNYALPIIALRSPQSGAAVWILSGIHGEEPAGPQAIAASISAIAELGKRRAVVLLPLNNPHGYVRNWRYLNTPIYSEEIDGHSVGDSAHLLPDAETPGQARAAAASSPEAKAITDYILAQSVDYPPTLSFDLHEDNLINAGYVYSQGILGAEDPLASTAVRILGSSNIPVKTSGVTRFDETIVNGIIGPVIDSSIDELMSAEKIIVGGRPVPGPTAGTVLVFETPAGDADLKSRIGAHTALLTHLTADLSAYADIIFTNGRIYTVSAAHTWAEAVAVRDGRISFVGSNAEAKANAGPQTKVIDLHGRMMLPGFQDVHIHPIEAGVDATKCTLGELDSIVAYQQVIAECAAANPDSTWVVGSGWTFSVFGAGVTPDRRTLDEVVPDRPVYVSSYDEHAGWANSLALAMAGITKDTPDPVGGQIIRDPVTGEPTGALQEEARHLVKRLMPKISMQEKVAALQSSLAILNAWGITSIQDASVDDEEELRVYKSLEDSGDLSLRVVAAMRWSPEQPMDQLATLISLRERYASDLIDASTAKIWQDGVMENYTAAMLEPYRIASGSRGDPLIEPEQLKQIVTRLDAEGFQIHFHAIGDAAVRQSLDAVEQAVSINGRHGQRHHISHLQMIDPADIPRFAALDVVANFQPLWAYADEYVTEINIPSIGEERARWMYPIRSVKDAGGLVAFGSDWSVTTANPFPQIETAITRQSADDESYPVFIPEERLDLTTAIDAFTINAAFVNKQESVSGSIEVGKYADLIILNQNLFEIEPAEISATKVLLTLFNGRVVYGNINDL